MTDLEYLLLGIWEGSLHEEQDYYTTDRVNPPPLAEIIHRWTDQGDKPQSYNRAHWYPTKEIWPHREYTWSRLDGRNSPEEWDAISGSMKRDGWREDEPAWLMIGSDGSTKLGEGNHRLAIAMSLGIKRIPVAFLLRRGAVHKSFQPTGATALKSAIRQVPPVVAKFLKQRGEGRKILRAAKSRRRERERDAAMSPEEKNKRDKRVDDIMDLLSW